MNTSLKSSTTISWRRILLLAVATIFLCSLVEVCEAKPKPKDNDVDEFGDPAPKEEEGGGGANGPPKIPKEAKTCDGIYISYNFLGREKEYPHVKNMSAQSWAFKAQAQLINMGITELKTWKLFIGFQHRELLVSVDGAVLMDGDEFPAPVGVNGTTIGGSPKADLKTSIETAGDVSQISVQVAFKGTVFGVRPGGTPMPKTIKLQNDGFKCPAPTKTSKLLFL